MIRKAFDRNFPPADADDAFDDADIDFLIMEDCTLLNVQLNECPELSRPALSQVETIRLWCIRLAFAVKAKERKPDADIF